MKPATLHVRVVSNHLTHAPEEHILATNIKPGRSLRLVDNQKLVEGFIRVIIYHSVNGAHYHVSARVWWLSGFGGLHSFSIKQALKRTDQLSLTLELLATAPQGPQRQKALLRFSRTPLKQNQNCHNRNKQVTANIQPVQQTPAHSGYQTNWSNTGAEQTGLPRGPAHVMTHKVSLGRIYINASTCHPDLTYPIEMTSTITDGPHSNMGHRNSIHARAPTGQMPVLDHNPSG